MAKKQKKTWKMRNGKTILIKDMTTFHIICAIKMFKYSEYKKKEVKWLIEERDIRLGVNVKIEDEPIKNRWSILDLRKDDEDLK